LEDGIYFDMPNEVYHAQHRLSTSKITTMMEAPAAFWRSSWMNPDREPRTETDAQIMGHAFHTARLEPEEFPKRYACKPDQEDFGGALLKNDSEVRARIKELQPNKADYGDDLLTTDKQVKDALKSLGIEPKDQGDNALERAQRLHQTGFTGDIWSYIVAEWEEDHGKIAEPAGESVIDRAVRLHGYELSMGEEPSPCWCIIMDQFEASLDGRTPLDKNIYQSILRDQRFVYGNERVGSLLTAPGYAEVSILYTCPTTGVKCQARMDKLTANYWIDLKTWDARSFGKGAPKQILEIFQYHGHHRGSAMYMEALEMVRTTGLMTFHWEEVEDDELKRRDKLIADIRKRENPMECWYIFQRRGGVPDLRRRKLKFWGYAQGVEEQSIEAPNGLDNFRKDQQSFWFRRGVNENLAAKEAFVQAMEIYGDEGAPWYPIESDEQEEINDGCFRDFWLDGQDHVS